MYLLFDIGRTRLRVAVSSDYQTLDKVEVIPTPQSFDEAMDRFEEITKKLTQGEKAKAGAGGVAGPLDPDKTRMTKSHLEDWVDKPLKDRLQEIIEAPVFLENDALLGALGETHFGEGREKDIVAFLTISSGVGGARVVKGVIDQNSLGFEPGHQIIEAESLKELEQLISGIYLEQRYSKKPEDITDPEVWESVEKNLAVGLFNTACYWSPDIIVIGGGVTGSIDLDKTLEYVSQIPSIFTNFPEVKKAKLGDSTGLFGSLAYLNQKNS